MNLLYKLRIDKQQVLLSFGSEVTPSLVLQRRRRTHEVLCKGSLNRNGQNSKRKLGAPPRGIFRTCCLGHLCQGRRCLTSHWDLVRHPLPFSNQRWRKCSQPRDLTSNCKAALGGSLSFTLNAPPLLCQRLNSGLELFPSGFHDRGPLTRSLHDKEQRGPQSRGPRKGHTRRLGNVRPNQLRVYPWAALSQLSLHLFILGAEVRVNT